MGISIADNFNIQSKKPLDGRNQFATLALMKAVVDANVYEGCEAYCAETDKYYMFKSTNTVDEDTGKWRERQSGGGGSYTAGDGIDITNNVISTKQSEEGDIDEIIDVYPQAGNLVSIVNAFNRGDIYSTNEKMIGQWIDGKPLYQCVLTGTVKKVDWNTFQHNIANIDTPVSIEAYIMIPNSQSVPYIYSVGRNSNEGMTACFGKTTFEITVSSGYISHVVTAIVRYTKTTDTAISIGSETEYSTDEKVVGTWIDGRPIYQKTILDNTTSIDATNFAPLSQSISNVSRVINAIVYIGTGTYLPCLVRINNDNVEIKASGGITGNAIIKEITIQYLKTT